MGGPVRKSCCSRLVTTRQKLAILRHLPDRLARSTRDLLNTLDRIGKAESTFRSIADTWADSSTPHDGDDGIDDAAVAAAADQALQRFGALPAAPGDEAA
jgi:hypothetical protein